MAALADAWGYFIYISKPNIFMGQLVFLSTDFVPSTLGPVGERHYLLGKVLIRCHGCRQHKL